MANRYRNDKFNEKCYLNVKFMMLIIRASQILFLSLLIERLIYAITEIQGQNSQVR